MHHRPGVIVYERKGAWAAGLRRHLARDVRLRETRTLADCRAALADAPASLVVLELTASNVEAVLDFLVEIQRGCPLASAVAVADRALAHFESLAREAGVVHFATSLRTSDALAGLAARHLARVPQPAASLSARIWSSLPWPDAAAR